MSPLARSGSRRHRIRKERDDEYVPSWCVEHKYSGSRILHHRWFSRWERWVRTGKAWINSWQSAVDACSAGTSSTVMAKMRLCVGRAERTIARSSPRTHAYSETYEHAICMRCHDGLVSGSLDSAVADLVTLLGNRSRS